MKEISITYSELRSISEKVMSFVRNETLARDIDLSSRIEADCRIGGDDIDTLLYEFSRTFNVNFSNFHFDDYFYSEGEGYQFFPISILFVLFGLLTQFIFLPFNKSGIEVLIDELKFDVLLDKIYGKGRKDLMIKDLVASAIFGEFQLRKGTKFILSQ